MIKLIFIPAFLLFVFCLDKASGYNCYSCSGCSVGSTSRTRIFCNFGCYVQRASSAVYTIRYDQGCYNPALMTNLNNMPNFHSCFTNYCNTISKLNGSNKVKNNFFEITLFGFLFFSFFSI